MLVDRKVAVVSGATSGIGYVVARVLAQMGMHVIAMGRDANRIEQKNREIRAIAPAARLDWIEADFASMTEVRRAADVIHALTERVDILINNAGLLTDRRQVTADELEMTFAVNHLAPFVLTLRLLPLLQRSTHPHVIAVSSIGHTMIADMCWDDLQFEKIFDAPQAYYQSKLANVLFTRELARQFGNDGLIASAVHPGMVASRFPLTADESTRAYYRAAEARGETLTEEQGADTVLWLAQQPQSAVPSGGYFTERKRIEPSAAASNPESSARLWDISVKLAERFI